MKKGVLLFIIALLGLSSVLPAAKAYADENHFQMLEKDERVRGVKEYTTPDQPTVYLTFDDGPSHLTPLVLNILKEEGIRATFFTLGQLAERHPEMIKRIAEEGHALGNHTYDHEYQKIYFHFDEFWKQIQKTEDVLYQITGEKTVLMRAPGGTSTNFDAFYYHYLEEAGYQVHDWNIDSGDSKRRGVPAKEIIEIVKKGPFPHEINLLLHDSSGHGESVKALPEIIRFFKEKGYSFAPLTQDVKPIQFSVKPNKWSRTTTYDDYTAALQQINNNVQKQAVSVQKENLLLSRVAAVTTASTVHTPSEALPAVGMIPSKSWTPPLLLQVGQSRMVFKSSQYSMKSGDFHVPLRALIEHLGGLVEWDDKQHKATIAYGGQTIEYFMDTQMMKINKPFQPAKTIHNGEFSVKNGSSMVPLGVTLEMLNIQVSYYNTHETKREVKAFDINKHV
jgi:peptidoglycan/xylan/chitin deacetylase (PgdA/CDA1 family)